MINILLLQSLILWQLILINCQVLIEKLLQIKQHIYFLKMYLKKLKTFGSRYFTGKCHFDEDGAQNYFIFQPMYQSFKKTGNTN